MHICSEGHRSVAEDYCDECGRAIVPGHDEPAFPPGPVPVSDSRTQPPAQDGALAERCPICATVYAPADEFCEACGHWRHDVRIVIEDEGDGHPDLEREEREREEREREQREREEREREQREREERDRSDRARREQEESDRRAADSGRPTAVWTVRVIADHDYFMRVLDWDGPDAHSMRFPHEEEEWSVELVGETMRIGRRNVSVSSSPVEISLADPGVSRRHATLLRCADGSWEVVDVGSANGTTINSGYDRVHRDPIHLKDGDRVHVGAWTTLEIRRLA
jgi:FHA domain-containing protein